ncbi:MAG: DNA methyltransferase [Chloroflexota bacterium]
MPLHKLSHVLQNGTFASRGSTRRALRTSQPDLFSPTQQVTMSAASLAPILTRVKIGKFFGDGKRTIHDLICTHEQPAATIPHASTGGTSAGKNTYTYDAHTYHTKVPPQGITEFIRHYLPEGGLVLDPFAGSGMTGVAAIVTGSDVILNELSPAACFISHNFTESVSSSQFAAATKAVLSSLDPLRKDLYTTICRECGKETEILYTVWSYYVLCPFCRTAFRLWDHCRKYGQTVREHKILSEFPCPSCGRTLKKGSLVRTKAEPVMLGYKCCSRIQVEHPLTSTDLELVNRIESAPQLAEGYFPHTSLPNGVNLSQPKHHGLTTIDRFYTSRNLSAMSNLWREIHRLEDTRLASLVAFVFTSLYQRVTRLSEFRFWGGSGNTARFNVPFIFNEANVFVTFERKAASILDHLETTAAGYTGRKAVVCNSATDLNYLPDESIDFIFTDPPFGANINYSDMNFLWEAWLGEFTDQTNEAIINRVQGKGLDEYENLMTRSLKECFRVLRAGHWMLLVFMNSSSKVWDSIRASVERAGFVAERIDIFDKQHGTFKQFVSENTAGCDLVLHCLKPTTYRETVQADEALTVSDSISKFIIKRSADIPFTNYLHVTRESEPDFRMLYSEWVAFGLLHGYELADFTTFRVVAAGILDSMIKGQNYETKKS